MSFSIAVSLFVSFTLTPMLASRWLKKHEPHAPQGLSRIVEIFYRPIERVYMAFLSFCMEHRWLVGIAIVITMASMKPLGAAARKGFLPVDDRAQFEVVVRLPEGRSVASTELVGERVARIIRAMPEVTATLLTVGDDPAKTPNQARIYVKLLAPDKRKLTQNQLKDVVREKILPSLPPELRVNVADVNEFGGGQPTARIQYLLAGPDLKLLEAATPKIIERMKSIPGVADVDSSLVVGKPQLSVFVDRQRAADLGVQIIDVAQALQYLVAGQKVSTYSEGGEQYDVRLRATPEYRSDEDALAMINVPSRKLGQVALADVVRITPGESPASILRFQRERQVTFLCNGKQGADEGAIGEAVKKIIDDEAAKLPKGFSVKPQGQTKLMRETGLSFIFGLLASLVFMYLILAAQFESWLHPLTILISLPLTLPFAIASVILFDQALDLYSFLGIFVLFGVVKKNAILQIDHSNHLREDHEPELNRELTAASTLDGAARVNALHERLDALIGRERLERALRKVDAHDWPKVERAVRNAYRLRAILQANKDRFRPILMTTFAFIAGMIPLVTAKGVGSGFNRATAGVVVGGQAMSLVLTLVTVPVIYSWFDDLSLLFWRLVRGGNAPTAITLPPENHTAEVGK
jgi:multidrug efflux pump subunit AcrB